MADIWTAHASAEMDLDREWPAGGCHANTGLLDFACPYVRAQLCAGGLGNTGTRHITETSKGRAVAASLVVCHMDISNSYFLEFC